jgi:secreted trypsin-like serine protease
VPPIGRAARLVLPLVCCAALLAPALAHGTDAHTSIVGGHTAGSGEYPWQVQVIPRTKSGAEYLCGGTLIADRRVLTAAHCAIKNSTITVRIGSRTLDAGNVVNVSSYARHPNYNANTSRYDVAVLQLASSGIAAGGKPLQLIQEEPSATEDSYWATGKMLAISGWGTTSYQGDVSNQLLEAAVPRVGDGTCGQNDYYGSRFDPVTMVCAGFANGGVDTCQGDSGGPLAASTQSPLPDPADTPSEWRLVGVTSWGDGCAQPKKPGVYARVAEPTIQDWILGTGPALFMLTVSPTGSGSGSVTTTDGNIDCPPVCSFSYTSGAGVTLHAAADPGSAFAGWSGAGCSGTSTTCSVTMNQARTVTATFTNTSGTPTQRLLTVAKQGGGQGTVTSSPPGIACGTTCSGTFDNGTSVTLMPKAASGSTFIGWEGEGCSGNGTCTVLMDRARSVTATFGVQVASAPPPDGGGSAPPPDGGGSVPPPDNPAVTLDDTPPVAAIASDALHMSRRGFVRVRIDCVDSPEDCLGDLRLRMRLPADATAALLTNVAHADFKIAAGDSKRVKTRLRRRARHRVRDKGHVRVRVVVMVHDAAGNTDKLRKKLVLSA